MATNKRKTRMYEPWGYRDQDNYQSTESIIEDDFGEFFADVNYKREDNKIHFKNKDGKEVANLDVNEFVKSDQIVEKAWYENGNIYIKFTNGDLITIDVKEILDENEFSDGLQVNDGVVSVLRDLTSERWLTVSEDGVKVSGIQAEIDRLDERIDNEIDRATSEEERIETKLDKEIQDRIDDVNAEENRAKAAELAEENRAKAEEQRIDTKLSDEITRATQTEQVINHRVNTLNDELDAEESIRESNDASLGLRITTETNDRISAVLAEKQRAEAAESAITDAMETEVERIDHEIADANSKIEDEISRATNAESSLDEKISQETERAIAKEEELDNRIDEIISGSPVERLDELIEKLGYKDNDTLVTTNEHEVAFGEWNISNTDVESSGQTVFSVGIGTSAHDRKNAIEVMKDGSVFVWVEGEFMNINKLLGQISHEVYDTNP